MKSIIAIAAAMAIGLCSAQTEPLANIRSYSDTTAKPSQAIMKKVTYPPLAPLNPAPMPTPTLSLPKAQVVNSQIIIPLPRRKKHPRQMTD
jgi:PBP1b-binding outer membrane lipoprotein LpoB